MPLCVFLICGNGDIVTASTFFGGLYHYQGELILIVHTSVPNNSFLSGFDVQKKDPYHSLAIYYLWHVATIEPATSLLRHSLMRYNNRLDHYSGCISL